MFFMNLSRPVQASLVDNTIVAVFRNSTPNLVWKFDLERNHSFTLTLQGEEDDYELGITSSKGEFHPVARFSNREDAEEALQAVQKVLMQKKWGRLRTVLTGAAGLFALFALYSYMMTWTGHGAISAAAPTPTTAAASGAKTEAGASSKIQNGVSMSADDVLAPPPE